MMDDATKGVGMTDSEKLQGSQMALQVAIQQREQALNQVIDLTVTLSLAQAEIAQLKAVKADEQSGE